MYSTLFPGKSLNGKWHSLEAPLISSAVTTREEILFRNNSLHLSECVSIIHQTNQYQMHSSINSEINFHIDGWFHFPLIYVVCLASSKCIFPSSHSACRPSPPEPPEPRAGPAVPPGSTPPGPATLRPAPPVPEGRCRAAGAGPRWGGAAL